MNLRDDEKKLPADILQNAKNERFTKYCKHKEAGKEVEEQNEILVTAFNGFLVDKLKDTGATIVCTIKDSSTVVSIRTTLEAPISSVVFLTFGWPNNMLTATRLIQHEFVGDIIGAIKRYDKSHPDIIQKLDKVNCMTKLETRTKFFK